MSKIKLFFVFMVINNSAPTIYAAQESQILPSLLSDLNTQLKPYGITAQPILKRNLKLRFIKNEDFSCSGPSTLSIPAILAGMSAAETILADYKANSFHLWETLEKEGQAAFDKAAAQINNDSLLQRSARAE
jgi:hypothetical protein